MSGEEDPLNSSDLLRKKSPDEQIKDKLRSGGLDPSRWFKVFKDELGVNIPEQLNFIGEESYQDLVKYARKEWEKRALRKFLGMSDEKFEKVEAMSQQQLRELEKQSKDSCESAVKNIENVCEVLEIPPDAQTPEDRSLGELTADLYMDEENEDCVLSVTEHKILPCKPHCPRVSTLEIQNVFNILGVSEYYPQKLTRKHALCIRQQTPESKQFYILEKIMMHNYQYWKCLIQKVKFILHPVDCLLALLLCADNFLRQDLIVKISTCKLAIPLLLPDPFAKTVTLPLWGMRSIVKEWKCEDTTGKTTLMECSMVECEIPIVSFMRFSDSDPDSGKSKSKILNEVIGDSQHNFFFHWDCKGGSAERVLVDGVVELCWYLPAGKEADSFNKAIAFTNLRGDARKHRMQFEFLTKVSFMNFVLLSQGDLNERSMDVLQQLVQAPGLLVLMYSDVEEEDELQNLEALTTVYKTIKLKRKSQADIKTEIQSHIMLGLRPQKIGTLPQFKTLKQCCEIAEQVGILIDENHPDCIAGQRLAEDVLQKVQEVKDGDSGSVVKDMMLPLQGREMWHTWAQHNKERHRHVHLNKGFMTTTETYNIEMDRMKDEIRRKQLSLCDPPTPVMKSFMSSLLQGKGCVRDYFLHWLKFLLDKRSRQTLPPLQNQYDKLKCELQKPSLHKNTRRENAEKEKTSIREGLTKINDKMVLASLGLEHLFRELGQMYESVMEVPKRYHKEIQAIKRLMPNISRLPGVAAELLLAGYPFELMDGDAAHVPMTWMSAVLDELHTLLKRNGDAKVFTVSVLGIQSSGKSTLMNTMFGVKFAVSAGRCTRGAFIQLIPVQKNSEPCDYLLVVDTEGLRAPELDSQKMLKHDNEMATFVIGLANVTIINIFGETPSDMQDILQTSVHAFLRMKKLELKPSCQFVHQNVTAIAASSKLTQGKAKLVENLNEMVRYAAKEEQCESKYTTFDQVMSFDLEKDVWYFPSLWKGDPPMAPVNPGYSMMAEDLKSALTKIATAAKFKFSVFAFRNHIKALWSAVLYESFVFSFKNMLEMTAYNELDSKLGQWSSKLQSAILKQQTEFRNKVFSSDVTELGGLERALISQSKEVLQYLQKKLLEQAEEFFENCEQVEIMIQWKEQTKTSLKHLCRKHQDQIDDYCRSLVHNRRDYESLSKLRKNYWQKFREPVRKLALELRGRKLEKKQLEREFSQLWKQLEAQVLTTKSSQGIDMKVECSIESCLKELFRQKEVNKLSQKLSNCGLRKRGQPLVMLVDKQHLTRGFVRSLKDAFHYGESCVAEADKQTKVFLKNAERHLKEIRSKVKDYSESLGFQVLRDVCEEVDKYNQKKGEFNFTEEFKIDLCLTVAGLAVRQFEEMIRENAPSTIFERLRKPFYIHFESEYCQRSVETAAAESLSSHLMGPIQTAIVDSLVPEVVNMVKLYDGRFHTKHGLLYNILLDLEKKGSFADYILHLTNVEKSLRTWIKSYTLEYCCNFTGSRQTRLEQLANTQLNAKVALIKNAAIAASQSSPKALKLWLTKFHEPLKGLFHLNLRELCQDLMVDETGSHGGSQPDFEYFNYELFQRLQDVETRIRGTLKFLPEQMSTWKCRPYDVLADEMIGCCKQCPFCGTKCEHIVPDHEGKDHRVSIHRPICLGGYRWETTDIMTLDMCTSLVEGDCRFRNKDTNEQWHYYKNYREIYNDWTITPNSSRYDSSFWKYFVAHYADELADHFKIKKPIAGSSDDIVLQEWKQLEREKVLGTLKASFGLEPNH